MRKDRPVAIVLGGTYPHIMLLRKLKERGYYTILVDYYKTPPAKYEADEHIQESTLDKEAVLKIAQDKGAELVISTCIDQANVTVCSVSEKLGLPVPYSYKTALSVTNKVLMKEIMIQNDIPTSKYYKITDSDEINRIDLKYPAIVKPTDSNSSKGVRRAENSSELKKYLKEALSISKSNEAIVEEFIIGKEVGLDCIIKDKKVYLISTRERRKIQSKNSAAQQIFGSFWPADISIEIKDEFERIIERIAKAFNLDNTPLLVQAIVNDNGINIIEFAPRIGGGENYKIIELNSGYDIIAAGIDSHLNKEMDVEYYQSNSLYFDNYIYSKPGVFGKVDGFQQLVEDGIAEYFNIYKEKGMEIGDELYSNNRIGVFTVKGNNKKEIFDKIRIAVNNIEVYDINHNSIMRKDIYSTLEFK